jgi:DNA-binding NarL/FixJ family response regulator
VADILVNDSCSATLFTSIRATVAGDETGRARLTEMASGAAKPEQAAPQAREDRFGLTPRELDIIAAVGRGETNRAIAHQLSITHDTVKHHLTNIFDKLGVFTRLQLVLFAMQHGLVEAGARLAAQMTA